MLIIKMNPDHRTYNKVLYLFFKEHKQKPCDSHPCKNGGTCINKGDSFSCQCVEHYRGNICQGLYNVSVVNQNLEWDCI